MPWQTKIVLGTANFGNLYGVANHAGIIQRSTAKDIINEAKTLGVSGIDTAAAYGASEEVLGASGVEGFAIQTKLPKYDGSHDEAQIWVEDLVRQSLRRLKRESIDTLLFHNASDLLGANGAALYTGVKRLADIGVITRIGVSIYAPDILDEIVPKFPLDVVQAPLNVFDDRVAEDRWVELLTGASISLQARSAFLQGLLLMSRGSRPPIFNVWTELFGAWDDLVENSVYSAAELCLGFTLAQPLVRSLVVGADSQAQLRELLTSSPSLESNEFSMSIRDERLIDPFNWADLR